MQGILNNGERDRLIGGQNRSTGKERELWAPFCIPDTSPFSSDSNNCHFVPLWELWRSLPLLSIGRLRCIPATGSQPMGNRTESYSPTSPQNASAADLFPGWSLLSSHFPKKIFFFLWVISSRPLHSQCCLLPFHRSHLILLLLLSPSSQRCSW